MRAFLLLAISIAGLGQGDERAWFDRLGSVPATEAASILGAEPIDSLRTKVANALAHAQSWQRETSGLSPLLGLRLAADRLGETEIRIRVRFPLIYALSDSGRRTEALALATETNALAAAFGDQYLLGESYLRLADLNLRADRATALDYLLKAERILPRSGPNAARLGRCWKFLGHLYHEANMPREALVMFEKAAHHEPLDSISRAESFSAIAALALSALSDTDRAVKAAIDCATQFERAKAWRQASQSWNAAASILGDRLFDAWAAFENSRRCVELAKDDGVRAEWSLNASALLTRIGRVDEALRLLSFAKAHYLKSQDLKKVADCLLNEGTAKAALDPFNGGLSQFEASAKLFEQSGDAQSLALANLAIARIHLANRRFDEASRQLSLALDSPDPRNRALALAFRASSAIARGDAQSGKADALLALDAYSTMGSPFGETLGHQIASMACEDLGDLPGAIAHLEKALQTLEAWRAQLQTPEFVIGTQDGLDLLVGRGAAIYARLGLTNKAFEFVQRAKAASLQISHSGRFAPSALKPGEVLIELATSGEELVLLVAQQGKPIVAVVRPWTRPNMRNQVQSLLDSVSKGQQPNTAALERALITPIADKLRGATRLILCPDDSLNLIPFSMLKLDGKPLLEQVPLTFAPSASVWLATTRSNNAGKEPPTSSLVLAITDFTGTLGKSLVRGGLAPLPMARAEAEVVRKHVPGRALLGAQATRKRFLEGAFDVDVLHVATHTIANRTDPSQLALVLNPSGPADSGMVYPRDLLGSKLKCRLAVLSACSSLGGPIRTGEGVQNFAWAFLSAGCPRTISTLWPIDDQAALAFAQAFYPRYAKTGDAGRSMQQACLALRSNPKFSSPKHWAAWVLTGSSR